MLSIPMPQLNSLSAGSKPEPARAWLLMCVPRWFGENHC